MECWWPFLAEPYTLYFPYFRWQVRIIDSVTTVTGRDGRDLGCLCLVNVVPQDANPRLADGSLKLHRESRGGSIPLCGSAVW